MNSRWVNHQTDANLRLMAEVLNVSETVARIMANRGIRTKNTALAFLRTSIDNLRPFAEMKDAKKALARISAAIRNGEKVTIYGDYDADGICSTAILQRVLTRLGANVTYYIPHRIYEGYGLNINAISQVAQEGTTLIIAVDNGISAIAEVAHAAALGVDVVIIDHHEQGAQLPAAVAIIDPKQHECPYPFKEMCAGGLSFKLATALCEYMGMPFTERDEMLVLASIATVCDIVPAKDENRIFAYCGMVVLNSNKLINPGFGSLLTVRGYLEKPIDTFAVGFVLGPCINAAGRLDSANVAVDLLLEIDITKRMQLVQRLIALNDERKQITADCVERLLANLPKELDKVIVIVDTQTHESLAGIVAGRIREATGRPTIVITPGESGMKGSGRSSDCYNLFEALSANAHLLTRFGGHAKAAGLTIAEENIPILRESLNRDCTLTEEDFLPVLQIDAELNLCDVTIPLANELARLAPFGSGNHEPLFVTYGLQVQNVRIMDEKNTLIFTFSDGSGRGVKGIAFGLNEIYAQVTEAAHVDKNGGFCMDVVYVVELNIFNGSASVQMRVKDFKVTI